MGHSNRHDNFVGGNNFLDPRIISIPQNFFNYARRFKIARSDTFYFSPDRLVDRLW